MLIFWCHAAIWLKIDHSIIPNHDYEYIGDQAAYKEHNYEDLRAQVSKKVHLLVSFMLGSLLIKIAASGEINLLVLQLLLVKISQYPSCIGEFKRREVKQNLVIAELLDEPNAQIYQKPWPGVQLVKEKKKEPANEQAGRPHHDCKVHAEKVSESVSFCRLFFGFEVD